MIQNNKPIFLLSENHFLLFFVGPTGSQLFARKNIEKNTKDLCVNPLKSDVQGNIFWIEFLLASLLLWIAVLHCLIFFVIQGQNG